MYWLERNGNLTQEYRYSAEKAIAGKKEVAITMITDLFVGFNFCGPRWWNW
tara:strand:+ start:1132 stop:1284 length:153 start_codon:yes stop_codon:yes gene_type:complete